MCDKNTSVHNRGQRRRKGRRCCSGWGRDSPAAHGADHREAAVPLQPVENSTLEPAGYLKKAVIPRETHPGAGFWQELWPHGEKNPH